MIAFPDLFPGFLSHFPPLKGGGKLGKGIDRFRIFHLGRMGILGKKADCYPNPLRCNAFKNGEGLGRFGNYAKRISHNAKWIWETGCQFPHDKKIFEACGKLSAGAREVAMSFSLERAV